MKTGIIVLGIGLLVLTAGIWIVLRAESTTVFGILFLLGGGALSILGIVQVIISIVQAIKRR